MPAAPVSVLLVNLSRSWGGGENWFLMAARALQAAGFKPCILAWPGSPLALRAREAGIVLWEGRYRSWQLLLPFLLLPLWVRLLRLRPQIVLLNASQELKVAGMVAKLAGVRHIVFRRGLSYPIKPHALNRFYIRRIATAFLANSQATFDAFANAFPEIRQKAHAIILNGIEPEDWPFYTGAVDSKRLVMSARLSPEKGIERAIAALVLLNKQGMNLRLHIYGEGPMRAELEALSAEVGVAQSVQFEGFSKQLAHDMAGAGLFVFTPHYGEGSSHSLLEAMALGLPCVAFDTPSMREVIRHGSTGFIAPDGGIETLAGYIRQLVEDPALRSQMGISAREAVMQRFTHKRVMQELVAWLGSLG